MRLRAGGRVGLAALGWGRAGGRAEAGAGGRAGGWVGGGSVVLFPCPNSWPCACARARSLALIPLSPHPCPNPLVPSPLP